MTTTAAEPRKAFRSLGASLGLFTIATVGEFVALTGWYVLHHANPSVASGFYQPDEWLLTKLPSMWAMAATVVGDFLYTPHPILAVLVLWAGFIVERAMVVLWLQVPPLVITPGGRLRPRWLVLAAVTVAEIIVWLVWVALAEAAEPAFAAAVLTAGIHVVHAYEVALITHRPFPPLLADPGVMVITLLESVGGVVALWLAMHGWMLWPLGVILLSLLIEHILQVVALRTGTAEDSL